MSLTDESMYKGHYARKLTEEEVKKLCSDTNLVCDFKQNQLEVQAEKNWDLFYKRNSTNFFKDRHWTTREFIELCKSEKKTLLEIGCGVGNFIFPLLEDNPNFFIHACDFSKRAIEFVKNNPLYDTNRCNAFYCDVTSDNLTNQIPANSVDFVTLIFVLSSIHPNKMTDVLKNIHQVLKPGSLVLFRDYGLYDQAMLRFSKGHKLSENFYVRQDGTRAFYFSIDYLRNIFISSGFDEKRNEYIQRKTINKKEGIDVDRIFIQAEFCKRNV